MRKISIVVLSILLQIVLCFGIGSSAEKNIQKQIFAPKETPATYAIARSKSSAAYLNVSFDPVIQKIPVPYLGHNIEQVYKSFDKRKKAEHKDEFETTEQYQRWLTEQANKPLFGSVGQDSILAFVVNPETEYDADKQTLIISFPTSMVRQSAQINTSRLTVMIKTKLTEQKSTGQNVYGAKVKIKEIYTKKYELAIHNKSNFETEKVSVDLYSDENQWRILEKLDMGASFDEAMKLTSFVQRLKIGPKEAQATKYKLSALILARPIAPYISYETIFHKATFKDPTEFSSQMYYVEVDLIEIWIYDKLSGEIISKIKGK